jgi:hypothetical protein
MKKSVRNIVSLVTSTCLVASLGVSAVSADELVEISANNDTVVEQNSTNNAVADTATKSTATQASTATKSASTADNSSSSSNNVVADVAENEGAVAVTAKASSVQEADTNDSSNAVLPTDDGGTIAIEAVDDDADDDDAVEVEDSDLAAEGESALGVGTTTDSSTSSSSSTSTTVSGSSVVSTDSTGAVVSVVGGDVVDIVTEAVEETVAPVTKDVVLTLDTSNSMNGQPKELVKQTAVDLVNKILSNDENARIALVGFNNSSEVFSIYDDETGETITYFDDADTLIAAISDMLDNDTYGDDSTDLLNALYQVEFLLKTGDGDEKSVVIMTDGVQGTNLMDEDGNVDYDIPNRYVFGDDSANDRNDQIIQFTNDNLKPLATIYAVGYFQNLAKEDADIARDFLTELASEDETGTKYYEASDKNIDEITDLITQDIVHKAIKDAPAGGDSSSSSSSSSEDSSDSPKTSDAGVAPVMVVSALAGAMLLFTKKKNK